MAGKILWLEIAWRERLFMSRLTALTGLGAQDAWEAAPASQERSQASPESTT